MVSAINKNKEEINVKTEEIDTQLWPDLEDGGVRFRITMVVMLFK